MQFNSKIIHNSLFTFFVFGSLFITFRVLLIGSNTSHSLIEYCISVLPEIFVLLIVVYFLFFIKKNNLPVKLNYFDWMVIVYIISNVFIGIIIAKDLKLSIYGFRMTYLPMIFYFIASLNNAEINETEKLVDKIFNWFFIVAVIGLVLYFGFYDAMITMLLKTSGVKSTNELAQYFIIRMTSIFWTPVVFGTFMATTFLYFFYKTLSNSTWLNYLFQMVLVSCILLSVSRGPMTVSIIGVLLLFVFFKNWKVLFISSILSIFVFIGVSSYISKSYKAPPSVFIKWIFTSTTETVELKKGVTRVDLWIDAADNLWYNMLGEGLGKAGHVGARFADHSTHHNSNESEVSTTSTDGWYLKLANETGMWGLFSYFILAGTLFIVSIKYMLKNGFGFYSFLFTIFIIVNIQNIASNVLDFYLFSNLYWFLVGLMIFYLKFKKNSNATA